MAQHKVESLVSGTVWKVERRIGDTLAEGESVSEGQVLALHSS